MRDYEKLKLIIDEIPELIASRVTHDDPAFRNWCGMTESFLAQIYGPHSQEFQDFTHIVFIPVLTPKYLSVEESKKHANAVVHACACGLHISEIILKNYLENLGKDDHNITMASPPQTYDFKSAFIVHGHDDGLKHSVARILDRQGIEPIILSERTNQGRTIIEKFEKNTNNVCCAICLFTKDDFGRSKSAETDAPRARQNVVLETGYFWGKLGRANTIILVDNGVELPSDLSGVVYTNTTNWQFDLLKEMKIMGYTVDMNKLL